MEMRLIVAGSRTFTDYDMLDQYVTNVIYGYNNITNNIVIVSGRYNTYNNFHLSLSISLSNAFL